MIYNRVRDHYRYHCLADQDRGKMSLCRMVVYETGLLVILCMPL